MNFVFVPDYGAEILTPEANLSAYIDRVLLPGKLHRKVYDPEGLFSTIPAISSALLGVFTGKYLKWKVEKEKKTLVLFFTSLLLLLLGFVWGKEFPINKNIWSSSFVLFAGGWSLLLLTVFYFIIDVLGFRKVFTPFVWLGCNSILIYIAAHGIINFEYTSQFIFGGIIKLFDPALKSALTWIGVALIQFAALSFLYKKKWFLKV